MDKDKKARDVVSSSSLRCGKRTYFFDIKLSQNNKKYLKITESTFEGEGSPRKYNSFFMFPEDVVNFQTRLNEMVEKLN